MSGPAGHSLTGAIARAWVHPRAAMARQVEEGLSEPRALFHLMLASGLLFVASLPAAVASARRLTVEDPVSGTVAAHIFGYFFVAPLLAYGVAALAHLCVRAFGGHAPFLAARSALFWSVLVVAPAVLAVTALEALALPLLGGAALPLVRVLGYLGVAFWVWVFAASLAEAEGLRATWPVVLGAVLVLGALVAVLATLAFFASGSGRA